MVQVDWIVYILLESEFLSQRVGTVNYEGILEDLNPRSQDKVISSPKLPVADLVVSLN